jgi:hypothetical protein
MPVLRRNRNDRSGVKTRTPLWRSHVRFRPVQTLAGGKHAALDVPLIHMR